MAMEIGGGLLLFLIVAAIVIVLLAIPSALFRFAIRQLRSKCFTSETRDQW